MSDLREQLLGPARDWQERHRQGSFVTTPEQFVNAVLALPAVRDALAAQEKLRRVEALAEELDGYTRRRGRPAPGSYDYGVNLAQADAAASIRRALRPRRVR